MARPSDETAKFPDPAIRRLIDDEFSGEDAGDYRVIRFLTEGGYGRLSLAEQKALGRRVVLKTMPETADAAGARVFLIEATVTAQLEHPNIIPVYDGGQDPNHGFFFSMKYIQGHSWAEVLPSLDLERNVEVLLTVCDAVAYAHSRGVVHRDLKPDNIMLGEFGEIHVMDWGLAVPVPGAGQFRTILHAPSEDRASGTPIYMAPEMAIPSNRAIGIGTDIYLLGAILFQIATGHAPHDFGDLDEDLEAAAANRLGPHDPCDPWVTLALRALATRPADRFSTVKEFQEALRTVFSHRESITAANDASADLARAKDSGNYEAFAEAIFGFKRALRLWEDNRPARLGLAEARLAYAEAALERQDLDLAVSQLNPHDPQHIPLVERVEREHHLRRQRESALRRLDELERRHLRGEDREWVLQLEADLSDPRQWRFNECKVRVTDGALQIASGQPAIAVYRRGLAGEIRLEFEARVLGEPLNDIACFFLAPKDELPRQMIERGYQFKYGAYNNTIDLLIRAGQRLWAKPDRPLTTERWYHVEVQRISGVIACKIDGEVLCAVEDPAPLAGSLFDRFGLIAWESTLQIRSLRAYRLSQPQNESLLDAGLRHLGLGHYGTAYHLFADVLACRLGEQQRRRAEHGLEQALFLKELAQRFDKIRAFVLRHYPEAVLELSSDGIYIDIDDCAVSSLEALGEIPLGGLRCSSNAIASLEPLTGKKLSELACMQNRIRDLSPLADMPLRRLEVNGNRVRDLGPLRGMALTFLNCSDNPITELSPLSGMTLSSLIMTNCRVADLEPLRGHRLTLLHADANRIVDLHPLAGQPIAHLKLDDNRIRDLVPISACPLRSLSIRNNPISDLSCLAGMEIESLDMRAVPVTSSSFLNELPIRELYCDFGQFEAPLLLKRLQLSHLHILVSTPEQRAMVEALELPYAVSIDEI